MLFNSSLLVGVLIHTPFEDSHSKWYIKPHFPISQWTLYVFISKTNRLILFGDVVGIDLSLESCAMEQYTVWRNVNVLRVASGSTVVTNGL